MKKVIEEAVKQALKFFSGKRSVDTLTKGAKQVMNVAAKAAKKGK